MAVLLVARVSNSVDLSFFATGAGALPLVDYWFLLCGLCVRGQVIQFALFFFIFRLALALATIGLLFVGPQIILHHEMFIRLAASAIEAWEAITPSFRRVRAVIQGPDFALRVRRWRPWNFRLFNSSFDHRLSEVWSISLAVIGS